MISCAVDKVERDETQITNPEYVWIYDGESTILKNVIADLKKSEHRESLERRLSKNEVMWQEAKFLLIEGKKRILVPFLSTDKENVIGVLALVKDDKGEITFDMTSRTQLKSKTNKLPFWNKGTWMGYFMALDRSILGIKNGNPGLVQRKASEEKLSEMFGTATAKSLKTCAQMFQGFYVSFYAAEEECDENLESTNCYYVTTVIILPVYEEVCWEEGQPVPEFPVPPVVPPDAIAEIGYRNRFFSRFEFLNYVNSETFSIGSPVITNIDGEECTTTVRIVTPIYTLDLKVELLKRHTPFYHIYGVTSNYTDNDPIWPAAGTTITGYNSVDHSMVGQNSYYENSIPILEYEGESMYIGSTAGGYGAIVVPVKYKMEINSLTGEISSISRI
ncbi:hypothetical protein [Flavobacterium ajazii]|uniref:hypothetical protein n=1 Tax=Flavobacterium ajazii TaxID=2692318 RepID=UPI0013D0C4F0|nr:hypothetical protein [Flavobacterium ajazii]